MSRGFASSFDLGDATCTVARTVILLDLADAVDHLTRHGLEVVLEADAVRHTVEP